MQNLRFPGQYYDSETGYQNGGFREYDRPLPATLERPHRLGGRIIRSEYVRGNPFRFTDPLGLAVLPNEPQEPQCADIGCEPRGSGGGFTTDEVGPINYGSPETEAASAPTNGQCPVNTVTRYVGAGEAQTAAQTG